MNHVKLFQQEVQNNIEKIRESDTLIKKANDFTLESMGVKYSYNFSWLGRPIIQFPQDIVAMQEIIWKVKPDVIVETGIAHGGSLIYYASMLKLLDMCEYGTGVRRKVIGVDIDIREHNRIEIESHPMSDIIHMFEGSSIDDDIVEKVYDECREAKRIIVVLDSMHTGDHVLQECRKYEGLVKKGGYLVVMDTITEMLYNRLSETDEIPEHLIRPWDKNNNAMTGMRDFLRENDRFRYDRDYDKLLITSNPSGYLECIK